MLRLLERRLDNVVYRMGFASSRPGQLVKHSHFTVNGKRLISLPTKYVGEEIAVMKVV